jgi:hypothetical protein
MAASIALKHLQQIDTTIREIDFIKKGISPGWKETASTSPSGCHLGH